MTNIFGMDINLLAVLTSGVAAMAIGFLWYSDALFGKMWRKEAKIDMSPKPGGSEMFQTFGLNFLFTLLSFYVLSVIIYFAGYTTAYDGAITAILLWIGFVAPVQFNGVLFEKQTVRYYLINATFQLVALVTAGMIIGAWQ